MTSLLYLLLLAVSAPERAASLPSNPDDGAAWVELARQRAAANEYEASLEAWRRAAQLGALSKSDTEVEIAAVHLAAGRRSEAIAALERALAEGYRFRTRLPKDRRFQVLSTDPRWKEIIGAATVAPSGTARAWRADLAYLESEIRRLHPRFRTGPLPPEFGRLRRELKRRAGEFRDPRMVVETQRLLASLEDGHTLVWPFGMRSGMLRRLPIALWWFDDGVWIVGAEDPALVGARVLKIGKLEIETATKRIEPYVSRDNPMQYRWAAPVYLILTGYLEAIGATAPNEAVPLELLLPTGGRRTVVLRPLEVDPEKLETKLPASGENAPAYLRRAGEPFWSSRPAAGVVYVQLNAIADGSKQTLAEFAKNLRDELRRDAPSHLVLDLRNNNGGDAGLADEMLRTLIAYDAAGGHIWVAIGRVTFSAAETLAARLDQWTSATFVGEPTGSRPNHFGNEAQFVLPHSGVRGTISSGWNQPVSGRDERIWIAPTLPVRGEAADYFAGRDPLLDRILREIAASSPVRK